MAEALVIFVGFVVVGVFGGWLLSAEDELEGWKGAVAVPVGICCVIAGLFGVIIGVGTRIGDGETQAKLVRHREQLVAALASPVIPVSTVEDVLRWNEQMQAQQASAAQWPLFACEGWEFLREIPISFREDGAAILIIRREK